MTTSWLWIVLGGLALLLVVTSAVVAVRHRRGPRIVDARDPVMRNARRAMAEMQEERRRSSKGTIRGEGGGGNAGTMYDAAYGSDTSAGA